MEREAKKRPEALRLMTHPGVGSLTALAYVLIIGTPTRFQRGKQVDTYVGMIPSEDSSGGKQRLGHISKQSNSLLRFLLVEAAGGTHQPGLETTVHAPGDASAQEYCQGSDGAEWLCVFVVVRVRFARGTARYRTWCGVEHRPLDGASRSLRRESEEVIVVEILIEEMFRSGRNRPRDYETSVVVDAEFNKTNKATRTSEWRVVLKKSLTGSTLLEMSDKALADQLLHSHGKVAETR